MKRKIVYCLPSLYIAGGMERVLTIKANYFADILNYDIYIILTDGKDKAPFYSLSTKIHVINLDINFDQLWDLSFLQKIPTYLYKQSIYKKRLKESLLKIKPDITISMLRREINFISSIKDGSIKMGELHVNKDNYRNFEEDSHPSFIEKMFARLWMAQLISKLKKLDRFTVLSNEDKDRWTELQNVYVIPNPLPFVPNKTSDCTAKKVITVGRYTVLKGFDLLADAWVIVAKQHPDWELNIYGGGDRDEYQQMANNKGIGNTFICKEAVKEIEAKYCESSIFAFSSHHEGFGMVLIEAMSCGIPAVSFACPCGPKDIIEDGEDGLLVQPRNVKELAEKICYLIEHEDIRKEMGRKAANNVKRFEIEKIAKQWEEAFNSVLKV